MRPNRHPTSGAASRRAELRLKGKTAIVTGAAMGIGQSVAEVFAAEGARVVIADIDAQAGRSVEAAIRQRGGDALFVTADVSLASDVSALLETAVRRFGAIHALVNNAAVRITGNAVDASENDWERCLDVDLKGAWLCSKFTIPHMAPAGGSIINIGSTHAFRTQPDYLPYAVAKSGLQGLTLSMAVDFGGKGIRLNTVCPGLIESPLSQEIIEQWKKSPEVYQRALAVHPMGRIGRPEDIAYACLFLASDESTFITGTTIVVDGGRLASAYSPAFFEGSR